MKRIIFFCFSILFLSSCKEEKVVVNDPWEEMADIVKSIVPPKFKKDVFNILDFGAVADSVTMNTNAFKDAISACTANGGRLVVVPKGKFLTGPIHLMDNVNLHLQEGSEILFSTNLEDYPLVHTSYEGTELMNFSPLVYAKNKKNIAITGNGVLNGQAGNQVWWP